MAYKSSSIFLDITLISSTISKFSKIFGSHEDFSKSFIGHRKLSRLSV